MKISLVMPTLNITDELKQFLNSLKKQTYKNFELIVVDQNEGNHTLNILKEYEQYFEIKYIKSNIKGLSLNRNEGLYYINGDIIGFPDDDCEYQDDTLEKVFNFFEKNQNYKIYSCRTLERNKDYGTGIMLDYNCDIKKKNVEETVKSITFFVNYHMDDIQLFDEKLGVGGAFGSGEETDYVLGLLHKGYKGYYFSNDIIFHPAKKGNYEDLDRANKYALGYGALIKKEVVGRKNYFYFFKFLKKLWRNIGGMVITKNKKYHFVVFKSRIEGFIKYKNHKTRRN